MTTPNDPPNDYGYCEDEREEQFWRSWDQADFERFRADPKRQALVDRILASLDDARPATADELEALKRGEQIPDEAMVPIDWKAD